METVLIIGFIVLIWIVIDRTKKIISKIDDLDVDIQLIRNLLGQQAVSEAKTSIPLQEQPQEQKQEQPPVRFTKEITPPAPIAVQEKTPAEVRKEVPVEKEVYEPTPAEVQEKPVEKPLKKDFEKIFGVSLLSKIGIATLVLGIAYFVKYAIDQHWINEVGRVGIGILSGAVLIGVAHKLRTNYRTFSSILIGGGISVLYITVMLAFWEYELFSQPVAFLLLILITALSVLLAIAYDKKELAVFSLLGGFASPLMVSSGVGNYIVLFSYLFILNTGMLMLAYKKQWKVVSVIAYLLTLCFYWSWLLFSFEKQYVGALLFGLLFFVQFYLLAMIDYGKGERKLSAFQAMIILGNNLSLFYAGLYIFIDYDRDLNGLITLSLALFNAIPLWIVVKNKADDRNMLYLLLSIVLSFVSLAIPIQLNGCAITMFWAAETAILLFLYQRSSIKVYRISYLILQALVLLSLMHNWAKYDPAHLNPILNEPFITGLFVIFSTGLNIRLIGKHKVLFPYDKERFIPVFRILRVMRDLLIFFVLFIELRHQLFYYFSSGSFVYEILWLYVFLFLAADALFQQRKVKQSQPFYLLLLISVCCYIFFYLYNVTQVRYETLTGTLSSWGYFAMHYFALPTMIIILTFLYKKADRMDFLPLNKNWIYWFIAAVSVIILSVETDNTLLMIFSDSTNTRQLLSYSHSIAYPILWGIISFVLMLSGMKYPNRSLRIISLCLFALIIAKLYLYDIWAMNQTGRILAFIFLGLLFLLVSFLYQKLKILLQKRDE